MTLTFLCTFYRNASLFVSFFFFFCFLNNEANLHLIKIDQQSRIKKSLHGPENMTIKKTNALLPQLTWGPKNDNPMLY